jgi:DNA-directed RNA polymerase
VESLASYSTIAESIKPIYGPTFVPPLPWVSPSQGCYRLCNHGHRFSVDMMRTKNPLQRKALLQASRSTILQAQANQAVTSARIAQPDPYHEARAFGKSGALPTAGTHQGLDRVFDALNVLNSQSWCINTRILEVLYCGPSIHTASMA